MNRDLSFEGILNSLQSDKGEFNRILSDIDKRIKTPMKKRDAFVSHFTKEYIRDYMTLNEYAVGKGKKDSFCNLLENGLVELGDMGASSSIKFGIYFCKETGQPIIGKSHWKEVDST